MSTPFGPEPPALILVVDDNATNLAVLTEALTEAGYEVAVATSGEGAIAQIAYDLPDLLLLDVMMPPGIDGFETYRRLKANPRTAEVPVIFMTALADMEHKVKGLSLGAVDYITKPFQQAEVLARVRTQIHLQGLRRTLEQRNQALQALNSQLEDLVTARTQELQAAQLRLVQGEKLALLGELVAGVAHEMNNPIGCILGNLGPAKEHAESLRTAIALYQSALPELEPSLGHALEELDLAFVLADLPKVLESIGTGSDRLRELSQALRTFTRFDASQQVKVDPRRGLESTLVILRHRLKAQPQRPAIQVVTQYGDLPPVPCYPGPLNQVFMNLLANAIDALEENTPTDPTITITTGLVSPEAIAIRIHNNGPRLDPALAEKIFEPQFTTKPVGKGTGLGLAISRQIIVETHGGILRCDDQNQEGVAFEIILPLQGAPEVSKSPGFRGGTLPLAVGTSH